MSAVFSRKRLRKGERPRREKISSVMMVHRFFFLYCKTEKNGGKGFFVRLRKSLTTDVSYGSLKPLKDYFYNRYENGRIEKTVETHDDCGN